VTIGTKDKQYLFGEIVDGEMRLNETGKIVNAVWEQLTTRFSNIELDQSVIMPNHVHGIIVIVGAGFPRPVKNTISDRKPVLGAVTAPLQPGSLGQIIAYFKYQSTKQINELYNTPGNRVWQRNYYEHIIRNPNELFETRRYIQENPLKWDLDPENPEHRGDAHVAPPSRFSLIS